MAGWPDYIGVHDASGQGVGGVVFGENMGCTPTVFWYEWPEDVKRNIITRTNRHGGITNSDLEMAGLLCTWLVMEEVCGDLRERRVAVFSDNDPTVSWVKKLASRHSVVAAQLIRAIALRMKLKGGMSNYASTHPRGGELDDGHPFSVVRQRRTMAL